MSQSSLGSPAFAPPTPGPVPTGVPAGVPVGGPADAVATRDATSADAAPAAPGAPAPGRPAWPTPQLLHALRAAAILVIIAFAAAAVASILATRSSVDAAARDTEQYVRIQDITADVLSAHAAAVNGFLPGQTAGTFTQSLAGAQQLITDATVAAPTDDRESLADLSAAITAYAVAMQDASSTNKALPTAKAGAPVNGATQLAAASSVLATKVVPKLDELGGVLSTRISQHSAQVNPGWLIAAGLLTLLVLVGVSWQLARRSHRVLNAGLVIAIVAAAAGTSIGVSSLGGAQTDLSATASGALATTRAAAAARADGYKAKAQESVSLVLKTASSAADADWSTAANRVRADLDQIPSSTDRDPLVAAFAAYAATHASVVRSAGGDYAAAIKLATGTGKGNGNGDYAAFDSAVSTFVSDTGAAGSRSLFGVGNRLVIAIALTVALALVAVGATNLGVGARLKEYA